ncbi:MAG: cytochrome c [Candidatus Hydrothermarchaeaceae archaeon]
MRESGVFKKVTAFVFICTLVFVALSNVIPQVTPSKELPTAAKSISISAGKQLVTSGGCFVCHAIGSETGRAPDLANIGKRAATRKAGYDATEYLVESLVTPNAFIVEGFGAIMPPVQKPPMSITDDELASVVMYLQSLGGKPSKPNEINSEIEEFKTKAGGE